MPGLVCCCGNCHPVCKECEEQYGAMIEDGGGLLVCPESEEYKVARTMMGEPVEDDLYAFVRRTRRALQKWRKDNPF